MNHSFLFFPFLFNSSGEVFSPERLSSHRPDASDSRQWILHSHRSVSRALNTDHTCSDGALNLKITEKMCVKVYCLRVSVSVLCPRPLRWVRGPKRRISRLLHQHLSASEPHPRGHLPPRSRRLHGSWQGPSCGTTLRHTHTFTLITHTHTHEEDEGPFTLTWFDAWWWKPEHWHTQIQLLPRHEQNESEIYVK